MDMVRLPDDILRPKDTSEEAWEAYVDAMRRMGPDKRGERVLQLSRRMRETVMAGIKQRHPDYSRHDVVKAWFRIILTEEQFHDAFGDSEVVP